MSSDLVCLQCGSEMEYDWAPCSNCGWKAPGAWDADSEEPKEGTPASRHAVLSKHRRWISWTVWIVLFLALVWLVSFLIR